MCFYSRVCVCIYLLQVDINPSIVKFEQIKFDTPRSEKLMIENTGQVKVEFYFVPKLQEQTVCKKWLSVEPAFGIIPPKESAEITLTVQVTSPSSQEIMSGQDSLDDILILRLENGRDYFITIQGSYVKSIFGASTQYLVNVRFDQSNMAFAFSIKPVINPQ
jgi:phosphatidylinositol-bisphosphatase